MSGNGRPFNTSSPLGKLMVHRGVNVNNLAAMSGVSYRQISDYLARRKFPNATHLKLLANALGVDPKLLTDYELVTDDPKGERSGDPITAATVDRPLTRVPSKGALVAAVRSAT